MQRDIIKELVAWIVERTQAGERLTNEQVTERSGYSRWHLQREFTRVTGHKLGDFMRSLRMEIAADALRTTDKPIIDIGIHAGYYDQQCFTRAFNKQFGIPPHKYRKFYERANQP